MSLFRTGKPRITLLFKECLGEVIEQQPELPLGLAIELAAEMASLPCTDIEALAQRLLEEAPTPEPKKAVQQKGNGFGASWTTWLHTLKTDQLCVWLADYDPQRAHTLYCESDMDLVKAMIELKTADIWQDMRTRFEACLLGFGGELKGQSGNVHEVDMTDAQSVESMIAHMKKLGF
jgi:hypothetical protein